MAFDPYWEWLEIPPDRRPPDFYALLGLPKFESQFEKIRLAGIARTAQVRRFCLGRHGAEATQLLGELAQAFSCLEDPPRKRAYDESLRARNSSVDAARDLHSGRTAPALPPVIWRPIPVVPGVINNGIGASPESPKRPRGRELERAASGVWLARRAALRRVRKQSAERKLAWLIAICALLAATIAVATREEYPWLDPAKPVASNFTDSAHSPQTAERQPAASIKSSIDAPLPPASPEPPKKWMPPDANESASREVQPDDEPKPAPRAEPKKESLAAAAPHAPELERRPESPPPEAEVLPKSAQKVAQAGLSAASKSGLASAEAARKVAEDEPAAEADLEDPLEKLRALQARSKLELGAAALQQGNYNVAIFNFAAAIEESEYQSNEVTRQAARRLEFALGKLKDFSIPSNATAREARGVLKEFRRRIERGKRRPAARR